MSRACFKVPELALIRFAALLGRRNCLSAPSDLALYEYDGGVDKARPAVVLFPQTTEEVAALVKICAEFDVPLIGRGAGTGLSGGSIPRFGGAVIAFSRMNRILEIDIPNECATVQPGVVNIDLTEAVQPHGYFFAPDPSSQRACTVGGNVAENAGGPHTLAYGVTTNHVLGIEFVTADGLVHTAGGKCQGSVGYDLAGLLTGSEGTLVLITKIVVRLMRQPESVKTLLAIFQRTEDAAGTIAEITARAITPVALEMLDGEMLQMVEAATHAGYPMDSAAVLLIELEGLREAVEEQAAEIEAVCYANAARDVQTARTAEERALLWKGRKNAFGAIGRISPSYYVQDGVVPRTQIAPTLRYIEEVSKRFGVKIGNIFHAGDGNLHPIILFDRRNPDEFERAKHAGEDILRFCVEHGGSITGEHGVGMEKIDLIAEQFNADSLAVMESLKILFDPKERFNPGKVMTLRRGCTEIRQKAGTEI